MFKKKILLISGVVLLSLGVTACQSNGQNAASQSTTQSSSKGTSPDITNNTSNSESSTSSTESSSSMTSATSTSSSQESQSTSSSEQSSSSSEKTEKTDLPGDEGLYVFPSSYQGTWYTADEDGNVTTLTIDGAKIAHGDDDSVEVHKVDTDELPSSPPSIALQKKAGNMGRGDEAEVNGRSYINVHSYFQSAGAGAWYGVHREEGQPVLVQGSGAEAWIDSVYWKTPELAKKYADEKFDDLNYN